MRLTLRTLLAYLDDALPPVETKLMGEKLAESEYAQEIVERIKTVTRRRRVTTHGINEREANVDPNTVADYLDNELSPEAIEEFERAVLQDDALLAEVAACHQTLSLVEREPMVIPAAAKRRMYRLVKGRESQPFRKPKANLPVVGAQEPPTEEDDDLLKVFAFNRTLVPLLVLIGLVGVLIVMAWLAIPETDRNRPHEIAWAYVPPTFTPPPVIPVPEPPKKEEKKSPPVIPLTIELGPMPRVVDGSGKPLPKPIEAPLPDRAVVGTWESETGALLVRKRGETKWTQAEAAEKKISSTDTYLALPGVNAEVLTKTGVKISLEGNLPELVPVPFLETRVLFHTPAPEYDADLTLQAGRILLQLDKGKKSASLVLRVRDEAWAITLNEEKSELVVDLTYRWSTDPKVDFEEAPRTLVYLGVLEGSASLRSGFKEYAGLKPGDKLKWDSTGAAIQFAPIRDEDDPLGFLDRWLAKPPVLSKEADTVLKTILKDLKQQMGPLDITFSAPMKNEKEVLTRRRWAPLFLQAIDEMAYVVEGLQNERAEVRAHACLACKHWAEQGLGRETLLANLLMKELSLDKAEAFRAVRLLRPINLKQTNPAEVDRIFALLRDPNLAVREMARFSLANADPIGFRESGYESGAPKERYEMQALRWYQSWQRRSK